MNEELKKYVNAYIDGEEVEVRYDNLDGANNVPLDTFEY